MRLEQATLEQLRAWETELGAQYRDYQQAGLNLDLTRGKPSAEQLRLSEALETIDLGNYKAEDGTDLRNYGGLDGIPEAKKLFADMLGVAAENMLVADNSSLALMHFCAQLGMFFGVAGGDSAWAKSGQPVRFLAPVPGYDRHFSVCQHLGIELIPVAMDDNGPRMDEVERLVKADPQIKGIWCVPRFSNPSGIVYSDEVVRRIAALGKIAGPHFRVFWDNAYCVHTLSDNAAPLANLWDACRAAGTEDSVFIFGSSSKITFAGSGVAFMAASKANLDNIRKHLGFSTIGPNKVNQMRHVRFLKDMDGIRALMSQHTAILKPRFDAVLKALDTHFSKDKSGAGMGSWTVPQGGYFVSFDTLPGLAKTVVKLAADAGVKLTPAGATHPYGKDPQDCNIRLAPSFPSVADVEKTMDVFSVCVKLASVRQRIAQLA